MVIVIAVVDFGLNLFLLGKYDKTLFEFSKMWMVMGL